MNYTQNHHLPQWVKSDRIMMDDFNQMCRDLEASLNTNAQAAAAARSAANSAQSAANSAQSAASSAQSTANTALTSKPYVVGTYTGTGEDVTVSLGFRPSFLIISGMKTAGRMDDASGLGIYGCATNGGGTVSTNLEITSSGFVARKTNSYPHLSESGRSYEYIAFK